MQIDHEKLKAKAEIEIRVHAEDIHPRDSFDDPRDVKWALDQLNSGNEWGWCCVEVRATFLDLVGRDVLGGCSYENETAFRAGMYFDDMVKNAVEELAVVLERTFSAIETVATPKRPQRKRGKRV